MSCNLSKFETYDIGRVVHDSQTGKTSVQIVNAPAACPDHSFSANNVEIRVMAGMHPVQIYDAVANHPVVIVPSMNNVEEVHHSSGFLSGLGMILMAAVIVGGIIAFVIKRNKDEEDALECERVKKEADSYKAKERETFREMNRQNFQANPIVSPAAQTASPAPFMARGNFGVPVPPAVPQHTTVVVNNGNDGLLTGMVIGEMLSSRNDRVIERDHYVERETVREAPAPTRESVSDASGDDEFSSSSSSSSSYSSNDSDSYSSSSSDSYSSSSSDSYSSDSGSSDSYSSDS